jgi:hypothetical protein
MKNNTPLKKVTFFCTGLCIAFLAGAQNEAHKPVTEVEIKKISINNGDTLVEEIKLSGEDAANYSKNNRSISELADIPGDQQKRMIIINETIEENIESDDRGQQNTRKVIIREIGTNKDDASNIIIEEDVIRIENENGEVQTIELKSGEGNEHKVIVLKEERIEEKRTKENKTATDLDKNGSMSVYPNPNDGSFTIEVDLNKKETAQITVSDINGRTLLSEQLIGTGLQKKQINLDHYGKGIFFILVEQGEEVLSRKVIVD